MKCIQSSNERRWCPRRVASAGRCPGMAKPDAATLRADPKAAAQLPADDPGVDEHLHATPQHPRLLRLRADRAAADPPAAHPAVDGAGPAAAADLPAAAVVPADGAGIDEHLHAD